ncbi:carbamoyl-phosphate synthase, large subunit [Thermovibrio ammonificans HB-1]|uniref:Carbamoyl phosphate synthase large chain n=1 Tax=Thermovibrio ammonificans (strain DSM 15698 / JCM 12110 / HB-1) TaxID=648996 RepID=E8T4Z3_THEA1|nr:carbamoyl-phosphate synthase large subunit [Thermovibrio ammonificans]ADU97525.1 carbamoyl-phosphate synthase, large subunit [Thermovibrio ammonificans HB-1]
MPKRTDLRKILIIGSGPIVIGQAAEFDYSGTQACKALKEEGYQVVLVNSNPATIMTDPDIADRTYIEPLTVEVLEKIIEKERPDALLPTVGGQTALNLAVKLHEAGILEKYGVELIGAKVEAIKKAEDRELFKEAMLKIGLEVPKSGTAHTLEEALEVVKEVGLPAIIRPAFTLGGEGGGVAYNIEEFKEIAKKGLAASPVSEILIEESVLGWKEYELEVMRDLNDNVVIICSIENVDPMGVHTGDSITVAPAQTLTDKEYQVLRDAAIAIIREIGVETGGSNVQFAVNPENGRVIVIEMNPRVSRSSALASKATGFPIAKIAAKLAVGYTLDELPNDITKKTPASFEPAIDYCVVKFPRWAFEKFPEADSTLTTRMKSVGEVMAIGRTFKEALLKAVRSLEIGRYGLTMKGVERLSDSELESRIAVPNADRIWYIAEAFRRGWSLEKLYELSRIDRWFLHNIRQLVELEGELKKHTVDTVPGELLKWAKKWGFSDREIASLLGTTEKAVREKRKSLAPVLYKTVDTCAGEFEAYTPYYYSTYDGRECEANPSKKEKVTVFGSGPNRIGQGVEFDYCCVHAVWALRELGYEAHMVNCNPETVSTDYDTSDKLFFEPLTLEDALNVVEKEKPLGVVVQFGGQTPLKLSVPLEREGVKILGTSSESIDIAEDRERFRELLNRLGLKQPPSGIARSLEEAEKIAQEIGFPVLMRPSYVLGGRAMRIVYSMEELRQYMAEAVEVSEEKPVLIDKFLEDAVEFDVDAVADGEEVVIGGVMEHIEEAGIHSGDSACVLPTFSVSRDIVEKIKEITRKIALELNVKGLINIQFAVKDGEIYIIEVNPRASRTVPFVSKATGIPLAKVATKVAMGKKLRELGVKEVEPEYYSVKEAVFPFNRFPEVDPVLGPEMKSTGEVMGIDPDVGIAFYKAQLAAGSRLPLDPSCGKVFISVKDKDKPKIYSVAKQLADMGFKIVSTEGTYRFLREKGIPVELVYKLQEGRRPNIGDLIKNGEVCLIINTPTGTRSKRDAYSIRRLAVNYGIPYYTTVRGAEMAVRAISAMRKGSLNVKPLQDYYGGK